jgi:hypothetical protein
MALPLSHLTMKSLARQSLKLLLAASSACSSSACSSSAMQPGDSPAGSSPASSSAVSSSAANNSAVSNPVAVNPPLATQQTKPMATDTSAVGSASSSSATPVTASSVVPAQSAACKRGVAYGHHSVADIQALSKGVSWWYNWDFRPDEALRAGAYREAAVEFVPMIWGAKSDRAAAKTAIPDGVSVLLGFNEPNFGDQANLSAADAAALWPELESIADAKGLRLVSPAVNFCGGKCQDTDPFHYLEQFFLACRGCRVDVVAMHIYVGCSPKGENKAEWLINHVESYKKRFTQPLWLTEFACDSAQSFADQEAFLEDAVAYLEAEPRIERYAWFSGRATNMAYVDLLAGSGKLSSLGELYVNAPKDAKCKH